MNVCIEKGTKFNIGESEFEITKIMNHDSKYRIESRNGCEDIITFRDFDKKYESGELRFISDHQDDNYLKGTQRSVEILSDKQKEVALYRKGYVDACLEIDRKNRDPKTSGRVCLETAIIAHGRYEGHEKYPSIKSVNRWIRKYKNSGKDIISLVDKDHKKGNRTARLDEKVKDLIFDTIKSEYLTVERKNGKKVKEKIDYVMKVDPEYAGLKPPSRATVYRLIAELTEFEKVMGRHGYVAASRKFPLGLKVREPTSVLDEVEIDNTKLDVNIVCEDTGEVIGRVWITLIIDRKSRMILGFYISKSTPSKRSFMHAVRNAICSKEYVKEVYPDIKSEWPCSGVFGEIVMDNGKEFHAKDAQYELGRLGISLRYNPAGQPQRKGRVEKVFRTIADGVFNDSPGKTFSNYIEKGAYKSEKEACLTMSDLVRILHIWVIDEYHNTSHRSLGMTPLKKWKKEVALDFVRRLPPSQERIDQLFWSSETRAINKYGIGIHSLEYQSTELMNIAKKVGFNKKGIDVFYDKDDIKEIYAKDPETSLFITIPCRQRRYVGEGISLERHLQIRKGLLDKVSEEKKREKIPEDALLSARKNIEKIMEEAKISRKRSSRKKAAKSGSKDSAHITGVKKSKRSNPPPVKTNSFGESSENIPDFDSFEVEI